MNKHDKILDRYICVSRLGSGFAAIHTVLVLEEGNQEPYWDIETTGIGRYETKEEALVEARGWAKSEGLKLVEG